MSTKDKEIEFKYNAEVPLSVFKAFCEAKNPEKFTIVSGYDHFYGNTAKPNSFYRHRRNTNENQLTYKEKLSKNDSFIRIEKNIDLPLSVGEEKIKDLCDTAGYYYEASIFKNCFIYNYEYYNLVYYVCYDVELKEKYKFIEIEMKEDYDWVDETEAYGELVTLEKLCKSIGVSSDKRIKNSLFELFRKEAK